MQDTQLARMSSDVSLGMFLRGMRTAERLSLGKLAAQAGLSKGTVSEWESDTHRPRLPEMYALLDAISATPAQRRQALVLLQAPRGYKDLREAQPDLSQVEDKIGAMPGPGELLRVLRNRRGLPLDAVAAALEISPATLSRWERDQGAPSASQRETLLSVLRADASERAALANLLHLSPGLPPPGAEENEEMTWESIRNLFQILQNRSDTAGLELGCLALERRLWPLAANSAAARDLLGEVYATHTDALSYQSRWREARTYAERTLRLLAWDRGSDPTGSHNGFTVFLALAHSLVNGGRRPAPRRGIDMLQHGVSLKTLSDHDRAWLYSRMAEYLCMDGATEDGLRFAARGVEIAKHDGNEGNYVWRLTDLAWFLQDAGRPAEALAVVSNDNITMPGMRARIQETQVGALLLLGKRSEAQDTLMHLNRQIARHNLVDQRASAVIMASRF